MAIKTAVILFNLGGPDKLESVKPFLFNLFNDKAIIGIPQPMRYLLAKFISRKREPTAKNIYQMMGGKSPILEETNAQKKALEKALNSKSKQINKAPNKNEEFKCFIAMRYWHPFASETIKQVKEYAPDRVILLPLYPQFSTTTSESSINDWFKQAKKHQLNAKTKAICCYPNEEEFITSHTNLLKKEIKKVKNKKYRILFSAHGLPQKIIEQGDPYQWQIEQSTKQIVDKLNIKNLDYINCYQSKVGPLKWLEPSLDTEIARAGEDRVSTIIVPISFISEHSETLVELDIEYKELAEKHKIPEYYRVPTLSQDKNFIESLARLCLREPTQSSKTICPKAFCRCLNK